MHLLIIAGFLGSGKTTLLCAIARALVEKHGSKLVVIENEVGKVGIDDQYLKEQGLEVREIFSGCICCTLRLDLITTLLDVERQYNPDIVILEPSGVAGPKQVLGALEGYGGEIESRQVLVIIDAARFKAIKDLSMPLVTDGIEAADIVVLNKMDQVTADELETVKNRLLAIKADANIIAVSALEQTNMDRLLAQVTHLQSQKQVSFNSDSPSQLPNATVHAQDIEILFA